MFLGVIQIHLLFIFFYSTDTILFITNVRVADKV